MTRKPLALAARLARAEATAATGRRSSPTGTGSTRTTARPRTGWSTTGSAGATPRRWTKLVVLAIGLVVLVARRIGWPTGPIEITRRIGWPARPVEITRRIGWPARLVEITRRRWRTAATARATGRTPRPTAE